MFKYVWFKANSLLRKVFSIKDMRHAILRQPINGKVFKKLRRTLAIKIKQYNYVLSHAMTRTMFRTSAD